MIDGVLTTYDVSKIEAKEIETRKDIVPVQIDAHSLNSLCSNELPDFIKESIDAYVACISGAITKDEYIKTVEAAGFQEVSIVSEMTIPVEEWVNDPIAKTITDNLKISKEQAKEVLGTVASVKVKAVKK